MTDFTPQTLKGPYPGTVNAGDLAITFAAMSGGADTFTLTERDVLLIRNTNGATPRTVTITSKADPYNRTADITAYSIPANGFMAFSFANARALDGWQQSNGKLNVAGSSTDLQAAVLRLP